MLKKPFLWGLWLPLTKELIKPFWNEYWKGVFKHAGRKPFFHRCSLWPLSVAPKSACTSRITLLKCQSQSEGVWVRDIDLCSERSQRDLRCSRSGNHGPGCRFSLRPLFLPLINTTVLWSCLKHFDAERNLFYQVHDFDKRLLCFHRAVGLETVTYW